jgi:hypothetical protein
MAGENGAAKTPRDHARDARKKKENAPHSGLRIIRRPDSATEAAQPDDGINAADLMSLDIPPPVEIVPGLLIEGHSLLCGKPKGGKSWMALEVAIAVASGRPALCGFQTVQGDVLYLALEDGKRRLQGRLRKLLGPNSSAPPALRFYTDWPRFLEGGLEALERWLYDSAAGQSEGREVLASDVDSRRSVRRCVCR